jgi:hypothetical protein
LPAGPLPSSSGAGALRESAREGNPRPVESRQPCRGASRQAALLTHHFPKSDLLVHFHSAMAFSPRPRRGPTGTSRGHGTSAGREEPATAGGAAGTGAPPPAMAPDCLGQGTGCGQDSSGRRRETTTVVRGPTSPVAGAGAFAPLIHSSIHECRPPGRFRALKTSLQNPLLRSPGGAKQIGHHQGPSRRPERCCRRFHPSLTGHRGESPSLSNPIRPWLGARSEHPSRSSTPREPAEDPNRSEGLGEGTTISWGVKGSVPKKGEVVETQ